MKLCGHHAEICDSWWLWLGSGEKGANTAFFCVFFIILGKKCFFAFCSVFFSSQRLFDTGWEIFQTLKFHILDPLFFLGSNVSVIFVGILWPANCNFVKTVSSHNLIKMHENIGP